MMEASDNRLTEPSATKLPAPPAVTPLPDEAPGAISALFAAIESRRFGVTAGGVGLLLPQGTTTELLAYQTLTRLPLAPPEICGLINARGTLLTVFDLALIPGWSELPKQGTDEDKPMILMIGKGDEVFGLLIHGFPKTHRALDAAELPRLPQALAPYFTRAFRDASAGLWLDADIARLLIDRAASLSTTRASSAERELELSGTEELDPGT